MTGGTSDFYTSADPLLSANNSLFACNNNTLVSHGPPSPPWEENDLNDLNGLDSLVDVKDVDEFLSLSPESLRLDNDCAEEVFSTFLTSAEVDFDDLSTSSSDVSSTINITDILGCNLDSEPEDIVKDAESGAKEMKKVGHCSVCTLVFASDELLAKHQKEFNEQNKCCHCSKTFSTLSKLKTHHRKHSKEKPFQCQICGKYYTHRNTLARHQLLYCPRLKIKTETPESSPPHSAEELTKLILQAEVIIPGKRKNEETTSGHQQCAHSHHSKVSKLTAKTKSDTKCLVCDKEFFDVKSYENHRDFHLKTRECCKCHKVLGNKSKLLTHHRSHTKELPYNCSLCAKSFAELSTLRKHEATHGERNFRCDICSKAFVRKDYLSKHLLTHRQTFKCSQCPYVCHNREDIQEHLSHH